ncbi:MAG: ATP-dependent helicase HrpB [Gemmatimonadaceae bacterium]
MRTRNSVPLPIDETLPRLRDTLRRTTSAVLVAPPGAGKTTRVPLALLDEPWLAGSKLLMLEPRRLAARAAAHYMAQLLNERVGETVGYRVRMDSRIGPRTRIEVVTEGVLTRILAEDPTLDGISLVIFDEFHERSLHADAGLALALHSRNLVRADLRVLVMSATLDAAAVTSLLGDAPLILSEGTSFPVETRYAPPRAAGARESAVLSIIERALYDDAGDILVFLPGAGEIRRVAGALTSRMLPPGTYVVPLFGAMPLDDQDRAIRPSSPGTRKIVLATTIAQTSLTIEGIRVVIDSGLTRVPRYSPRTGMTRLETVTVSRSAADQRRGRAGRLAPGVCYRLWDAAQDALLREHDTPEILEADLAPLALDLAAAGVAHPAELHWLDAPPAGAFAQARVLLHESDALDQHERLTTHGCELAALGTHPRLAHMLVRARSAGHGALACDLAAIVEERDVTLGASAQRDPDVRPRLDLLHGRRGPAAVDAAALHRVRAAAERWRERISVAAGTIDAEAAGWVLALAYPDRIAQRRPGVAPRYVLRNGAGAVLPPSTGLHNEPFLVAAELDGRRPESLVLLAAPLALLDIEQHFADQIERREAVTWDETANAVSARRVRTLGAIVLSDDPLANPDTEQMRRVVSEAIIASDFRMLTWTKDATALRDRMAFLHAHDNSWLDMSNEGLRNSADAWLISQLTGVRRLAEIQRIPVAESLTQLLSWQQRAQLDQLAPVSFVTPSGFRARIDYSNATAPVLPVKLQEMFGLTSTPRVLAGRVPLTLHLLSPSQRPVQVTQDLESFWKTGYAEVRRELRARYPKHRWPEDPGRRPKV